jgi:hypothetical protein
MVLTPLLVLMGCSLCDGGGKSPAMSTETGDVLIFFLLVEGVSVYGPAPADADCESTLFRQFGTLTATGSELPK